MNNKDLDQISNNAEVTYLLLICYLVATFSYIKSDKKVTKLNYRLVSAW